MKKMLETHACWATGKSCPRIASKTQTPLKNGRTVLHPAFLINLLDLGSTFSDHFGKVSGLDKLLSEPENCDLAPVYAQKLGYSPSSSTGTDDL